MSTIRIPTPLRSYTKGETELNVNGSTVGEALADLTNQYPDLAVHLYDDSGVLRAFVNVFINEENIRHLQGVETPLTKGDKLMIIPSIAGG